MDRLLLALTLMLSVLTACGPSRPDSPAPSPQASVEPVETPSPSQANQPALNFSQEGTGQFRLQGRDDRLLTRVSLTSQASRAELALQDQDGTSIRFSGQLISQTPNEILIDLTNSGNADASGLLRFTYRDAEIAQLSGEGQLDGQPFAIDFSADTIANAPVSPTPPPTDSPAAPISPDLNLAQDGSGLFTVQTLEGPIERPLRRISVIRKDADRIELALRYTTDNLFVLGGVVDRQDAYTLTLRFTDAGSADAGPFDATGTATIEYGADNSITTLFADGSFDGQPFSVQFSAPDGAALPASPSPSEPSLIAPPTASASTEKLTCIGNLRNREIRYQVEYSPESGFSYIQFQDPSRPIGETNLIYSGTNREGQDIFRGTLGRSEVIVVDLANGAVTDGSQVSVGLNGQWGRGTCQP